MTAPLASAYDVVLGVHILAVVIAFGVTFAYPIIFAVGARIDPRSVPTLHRIELATERILVSGGLVLVLGAGIFLASDGHHWSEFFVQWGIGAVVVIGAVVGAVMIPATKRAAELADRDIAAARDGEIEMSGEYQAVVRRLNVVGSALSLLVVATVFIMAIKP
ncbi:MAG TPA: DUF2269 family protein [Solirubrobacteraceae bacterium]|nr:DUF2269 family protein [Solirubrobacteraceae bacterium]